MAKKDAVDLNECKHQERRLLLVDDYPASLDVLIDFLDGHGFGLQVATNGQSALEKARLGLPDIVLLDINMPEMDGFEVCRRLKIDQSTSEIPVIFISAADSREEKIEGFSVGACDFISKPFLEDEVLIRINLQLLHVERQERLQNRLKTYENHFSAYVSSNQDTPIRSHPGDTRSLVGEAMDILARNLTNPPTLNELAKMLGTNQNKLSASFREHLSCTVYDFLRAQRLEYAVQLLSNTPLQIAEIAAQVGYRHSSDFSAAFKTRYGVTPRLFKQNSYQNHVMSAPFEPEE